MTRVDRARRLAYDVVRAVDERDAYANLLLPRLADDRGLDARDAAFASELGYGTLRALGTLDHVIGLVSSRPIDAVDPPVRDAVRLGVYQLLRTRVPPHAAVATTVDLVREVAGAGAARFANAVLRRVADRHGDLGAPEWERDPVGHLAVTTAHPRWVVEVFRDALGGDLAETRAALEADDARPEVHLVARPLRLARADLLAACAAAGCDATAGPWSPYAVRLAGGDPRALPPVAAGRAAVQDEGSQLAALALAGLAPQARTVLDLCAGPGGKAALLAGLLPDARLLAVDVHAHRARLVRDALEAAAARNALALHADGTTPAWPPGGFDAVLVDAPCSGLGALRRRPEARWRRTPDDVAAVGPLQRALLHRALDACRPGGHVLYVVCSPHPDEGDRVVADVLAGRDDAAPADLRAALPAVPDSGSGKFVQLWPHRHGTDAMFLAGLYRAPLPRR